MLSSKQPKSSSTDSIFGSLVTLAVPIVLANILQAGYQLTDAFWVGRLGSASVAAVSVVSPIVFLSIALGTGLAIAGSTLIAQYFGAQNQKMVNHVAAQTVLMVAIVSVVLGGIGYYVAPSLLQLMGVTPEVYAPALGFMRVSFVGLVFNFVFFMFQSIMRGIGEAVLPLYIVSGTVLLNFVLDPLFIFGFGSIPALGVMGAALATLGTQSIAAMLGLLILLKGKYGIHLFWRDFIPDRAFISRAFFLGLPASIEMSARALSLTVMTFLITSFGTLTVAAYGVASNMLSMVLIPGLGLSMAVSTLVGQSIGAGELDRAGHIGRLGMWLGFWTLSFAGLLIFIFAPFCISFFIPGDSAVTVLGTSLLRIMALSWGFMGMQLALNGVLRASGNMIETMFLTLVSQWILQFPLAYILSKHTTLGVDGIWWAFPITNVLTALLTFGVYAKGDWKKKRILKQEEVIEEKVSEEILAEESFTNRS